MASLTVHKQDMAFCEMSRCLSSAAYLPFNLTGRINTVIL